MTKLWRYVLAAALLAVAFATRAPFLGRQIWNLDEGSTFTMAQIVREGGVLYRDAADNRTPLVPYLKAAVFAVAGDWNATAIHVLVALAIGGAAIGVWQLCRRLGDERTGWAAAGLFLLFSFALIGVHESQAAHTEWFQIFFSVPAFLAFARAAQKPSFVRGLGIGALFGAAALCKQPGLLDLGVTLVIAALLAGAARGPQRRAFLALILGELGGVAAVFAATFAYFAANGALGDFVMYAWTYNTKFYVPEVPLLQRWSFGAMSFRYAWMLSPGLLVFAVGGALVLTWRAVASVKRVAAGDAPVPVLTWLILGWSASGIASTMLSGRSFSHYVIGAIPGLSLACGWALVRTGEWAARRGWLPRLGATLVLATSLAWAGTQIVRQLHEVRRTDDFSAADRTVLEQLSAPGEKIFVWGYLPEIHFYSRRLPNTRFVYSVFLTGMIPWTNVASLVDTKYAIVPGAWEKFWADFNRTPPPLIVDTGGQRSWAKYPLAEQPALWSEIRRHYLRVGPLGMGELHYRYYVRDRAPGTTSASATPATPGAIETLPLEFTLAMPPADHGEITFVVPSDATEVRILPQGSTPRATALPPLRGLGAQVRLGAALAAADLRGTTRIEVRTASGRHLRGVIDLTTEVERHRAARRAGPALQFANRPFRPLEAVSLSGPVTLLPNRQDWLAHAPSCLIYDRPQALKQLILEYGVDPDAWKDPNHEPTSGADLLVEFEPAGGAKQRLYVRQLHPAGRAEDQPVLRATIAVPGNAPGRLFLRFLTGPGSDSTFDWTYWRSIRGTADGPAIVFGTDFLGPREQSAAGGKMTPLDGERWLAHAPSRAVYDLPPSLREITFGFGVIDEAFADGQQGKTDGVTARVLGQLADGTSEVLFERHLDPVKWSTDRGPQTATVAVPPRGFRTLTIAVDPGPHQSSAFDWSYLENLRAVAYGPGIDLGDGRFLASEHSLVNGESPMVLDTFNGTCGAHAPSEVVYRRPPALAAVSFSYGLFEASYFDAQGRPQTDGIEAVVEFEGEDGRTIELFRRELTPATRPADRGRQRARVELPPSLPGRLRFRITPGPSGSNAFDWAYFIDFQGELAP